MTKFIFCHPARGMCYSDAAIFYKTSYKMFSEVNHLSGKQTLEAVLANAFTANSTVTNCPLSPDVSALICFAPLMIFEGHYTVVTPITSRLYSNYHLLECMTINHRIWLIKFMVVAMKLVALAKLVFVLIKHYFVK